MNDHIAIIYQTRHKLAAIGEVINNQHLAALMICSLPPIYDGLITVLEVRDEHELNSVFVRSKLVDEFSKRMENCCESETCHTTLKA